MTIKEIKNEVKAYGSIIDSVRKVPNKDAYRIRIWSGNGEPIANEIAKKLNGTVGYFTTTNRYAQSSRDYYVEVSC